VKIESVIRRRLRRLQDRYKNQYIKAAISRRHDNCLHNIVHYPKKLPYVQEDLNTNLEIAPRTVTTLVVIQDNSRPIHICTYGQSDPETWSGLICDDTSIARICPFFQPKKTVAVLAQEFDVLLEDDRYVYDNFLDIATLQWVLGYRIKFNDRSWWIRVVDQIRTWIRLHTIKPESPQLPSGDISWIWNNDSFKDPRS
jgi:hypothetical protein